MPRSGALPRTSPVTIQAPADKLRVLGELQRRDAEATAARICAEDPTPGHPARRLNPEIVPTPALGVIDAELVLVRDALPQSRLRVPTKLVCGRSGKFLDGSPAGRADGDRT